MTLIDEQESKLNSLKKLNRLLWFFAVPGILLCSFGFISGIIKLFDDRVKSTGLALVVHNEGISLSWLNFEKLTSHMVHEDLILCLKDFDMPLLYTVIIVFLVRALLISGTYPVKTGEKHHP